MSKQYLILIEQLVRDGRSEREIEQIVERALRDDADALHSELDEPVEQRRAA